MDKYEVNLKIEQIKKLASKKDFQTASKVAKALDLRRIKDWQTLALLIQVHDAAGDLEEAREVSVIAYNKNLGGRRLVYKLADICLRMKEYDEAEELYKDYVKMAPRDPSRYVLEYKILKAQKAEPDELIEVLEEYRDHEIDEKYLCELAYLYSNTGRTQECVEECDEIITLFRDGVYVERAIELKKNYASISPAQQKILDEAAIKAAKSALAEETGDEDLVEEEQPMRRQETREMDLISISKADNKSAQEADEEDIPEEETAQEEAADEDEEPAKQGKIKSFFVKTFLSNEDDEEDEEDEDDEEEEDEIAEADEEESQETVAEAEAIVEETEEEEIVQEAPEAEKVAVEQAAQQLEDEVAVADNVTAAQTKVVSVAEVKKVSDTGNIEVGKVEDYVQSNAAISAASASIQQMIENAKNKIDTSVEMAQRQAEEEKKEAELSNISVPVRNYGVYDTHTLQTEIINSMSELFSEENAKTEETATEETTQEGVSDNSIREEGQDVEAPEEQIEGQLSIEDWIEVIREEKYSKQQTKEFSRAELEKALEKREQEHLEYERLKAKVEEYEDPVRKKREALERMILNSVKTDLAIRTGKATAKLENDVILARQERMRREEEERLRQEREIEEAKRRAEEEKEREEAAKRAAELEKAKEELRKKELEEMAAVKAVEEALAQEAAKEVAATVESEKPTSPKNYSEEGMAPMKLPEAVKKYFKKYEDVEDLEKILVSFYTESVLRNGETNSSSGNVIISGNHNSDKTGLAMSIIKGLNVLFPENPRKVARTTGESINARGIEKVIYKLKGTVLVVEDAGSLSKDKVKEMLRVLDTETDNMLVILEDTDDDIDGLINQNPGLTDKFNHRIQLKYLTVNEMVAVAKKYALEQGYMIDDNALLALYLAMDKLNNSSSYVENDDIYEVMDEAMNNTDKRTHRRLFGRKKSDSTSIIIEADFNIE